MEKRKASEKSLRAGPEPAEKESSADRFGMEDEELGLRQLSHFKKARFGFGEWGLGRT